MQYGHVIGHAPTKLTPVEVKVWENDKDSRPCSIDMKSSTLPLTSPCSGTKRKTTVPLFFASTGGLRLLSFIPILHLSLPLNIFSVLHTAELANSDRLKVALLHTYTASVSSAYQFLQSFSSPSSLVPTGSDCPYFMSIPHPSLQPIGFTVLHFY